MIGKTNKGNYACDGDDDDSNRNFHAVNVVVNGESVKNVSKLAYFVLQTSDLSPDSYRDQTSISLVMVFLVTQNGTGPVNLLGKQQSH